MLSLVFLCLVPRLELSKELQVAFHKKVGVLKLHVINREPKLSDFTHMDVYMCIFHSSVGLYSEQCRGTCVCCFPSTAEGSTRLPTVAPGQSVLHLWRALAGWLMGQARSLQPACQEEMESITLVSVAMLPGQLSGLGRNISRHYVCNFKQHFINHAPPGPKRNR